MTTDSPPTQAHDQEVTLLDQIRWVVAGQQVDDVLTVAMMLLVECVVQKSANKATALKAWDAIYAMMADEIDGGYDNLKSKITGVLVGQRS